MAPSEQIVGAFSKFKCSKDIDIESFIHNNAELFQSRGWCTVYLLLDEELLSKGEWKINAYFTLSHRSVSLDNLSRSLKKKLLGGRIPDDETHKHFILIGQLGKHIDEGEIASIDAYEILDYAFSIIAQVKKLITCNAVMVECKDIQSLKNIYADYGFKQLGEPEEGELLQYYTNKI